jgi:protein TonB
MKELFACMTPAVFSKKIKNRPFLVASVLFGFMIAIAATTMASTEYDAADVDKPPKIVRSIPIKFPAQAKKDGVTGKVVIRCLIGTNGKADKMEIVESEPAGIFDKSALSTLKYFQFRPGIRQGEMVATWVKVPIKFE